MTAVLRYSGLHKRADLARFLNTHYLTRTAVEVGTHRGDFARVFLNVWRGKALHCVDPYTAVYDPDDPAAKGDREEDLRCALDALRPYVGRWSMLRETSEEACKRFDDESLDFVHIDAVHRYDHVIADLFRWWEKIIPGGVLSGHDFVCPSMEPDGEGVGPGGWGCEVQPAVYDFADEVGLDIWLVTEPYDAPWSFYFLKPER